MGTLIKIIGTPVVLTVGLGMGFFFLNSKVMAIFVLICLLGLFYTFPSKQSDDKTKEGE